MAKLPQMFVHEKPRTVADLQCGERSLFGVHGLKIDSQHDLYVMTATELAPPVEKKLSYGEIFRDQEGKYHVDLKDSKRKFRVEDLTLWKSSESVSRLLAPIESVTWDSKEA